MQIIGLLLLGVVVSGQQAIPYDELPTKSPSVLRIVSTMVSPYLELRPISKVTTAEPENSTCTASDMEPEPEPAPVTEPNGRRKRRQAAETILDVPDTTAEASFDPAAGEPTIALIVDEPTEVADAEPSAAEPAVSDSAVAGTEASDAEPDSAVPTVVAGDIKEEASTEDAATEAVTSVMTTEEPEPMTPYQGFIPDLMDLILPHIPDITAYEIYTVEADDDTSAYAKMLEEVMSGRADVAAGPMTVTLNKEDYVDFTYPFQRVEATIVMHKTLGDRIHNLEDLVNQKIDDDHRKINYGVRKGGAIHKVLIESTNALHKKMLKHIETDDVALKETNALGVKRARYGGYVFIIEGSLADWVVGQPPCDLIGVKAGFFKRQYAFAVKQRSEWRDKLNRAIIEVNDQIESLREKWLRPSQCSIANWKTPHTLISTIFISFFTILLSRFL